MSKDGCIITAASLLYCMTLCYSKQLHIAVNQDLLINFFNFTFYQDVSTIGLVGLFYSNSDRLISSLLSASASLRNRPFLSSSASVSVRDKGLRTPPQYYRILQSANIFIDAITVLASDLGWQRIVVVTESTQSYFF